MLAGHHSCSYHRNGEATNAHSLLLVLSHRSTCPNTLQKFPFCPPTTASRLNPHLVAGSPAAPLRQAVESGRRVSRPGRRGPAYPTSRPPIGSRRGPGAGVPRSDWPTPPVHPALAMVTTLGPPGEFQIPPPPATAPLPSGPGPRRPEGRPALPRPPAAPSPLRPGAQERGKPGKGVRKFCWEFEACCGRGSSRCSALLQHAPQLNPFPPAVGSRPGGSSRDALALRPLHCQPRSPRPGTRGLRTSDPPRLGGAGTGLTAAAAAGRAEGGPRSLLLPPGGEGRERRRRGGGGGGGAPGGLRPHSDPGRQSGWGGGAPA